MSNWSGASLPRSNLYPALPTAMMTLILSSWQLTLDELQALYAELSQLLAETAYDTASRRNCLASLKNTIREINVRYAYQWKLGAGL